MSKVKTVWECATYDVWGNAKDGYDVNDVYRLGDIEIEIKPTTNNEGTEHEFISAYPTDKQIRDALGIKPRVKLDLDGDDLTIYVRLRDGYPAGELHCVSHKSLSPIKE